MSESVTLLQPKCVLISHDPCNHWWLSGYPGSGMPPRVKLAFRGHSNLGNLWCQLGPWWYPVWAVVKDHICVCGSSTAWICALTHVATKCHTDTQNLGLDLWRSWCPRVMLILGSYRLNNMGCHMEPELCLDLSCSEGYICIHVPAADRTCTDVLSKAPVTIEDNVNVRDLAPYLEPCWGSRATVSLDPCRSKWATLPSGTMVRSEPGCCKVPCLGP